MKRTMIAACILSLVACGGSKDDVATDQRQDWESRVQSLVYSFPDNAQQEVPTSSPVVLRFSSPVRTGNAALHDKIVLRDSNNTKIEWADIEEVDNGQSLLLHPQQKLSPLTTYQLSIAPIELQKGETRARNLTFSTRAAYEGPKSLVADDEFTILRTLPNDLTYGATDTPVDIMEFTTFRVQFSQPLDRSTVKYGDVPGDSTVQLTGPDGLIDAHVIVSGPYLTIDPKEDLQPDVPHRITFTTGVKSIYGDTMPGGSFGNENDTTAKTIDFTPKATGPRGNMVQDIADTLGKVSPLTGRQINEVPMASVLLGEDTATQASGIVAAELAFVPDFPDATPLRVKRGSLIEGASIDVLIGGEVPAGFESGKVRMDFLSDATGYLLPNPYSDTDDAPRQVRLWMDVAVSTETPQANGAITQDLLHIELVGTSLVDPDTKLMTINAVGVVEPNVLGSERATGLLSFYMEEVGDQDNPPVMVEDTTGPVLQSWTLGREGESSKDRLFSPGDSIVFIFNKPIDPESIVGRVELSRAGNAIETRVHVSGSSIVIDPLRDVTFDSESEQPNAPYSVFISRSVSDLTGNNLEQDILRDFWPPLKVTEKNVVEAWAGRNIRNELVDYSPVVLAAYPGFPCVLEPTPIDLSTGFTSRCAGGNPGITNGLPGDVLEADDPIPVMELPGNRPIIVHFSKDIDVKSVELGKSFVVAEVDAHGEFIREIEGILEKEPRRLIFRPKEPWAEGTYFKYALRSGGYQIVSPNSFSAQFVAGSDYTCDGEGAICDTVGLPLQTQVLGAGTIQPFPNGTFMRYTMARRGNAPDAGGPELIQYFKGGEESTAVLLSLNAPSADTNSNFFSDRNTSENFFGFQYVFENEEAGPLAEADMDTIHELDPDGVRPSENSVKILSRANLDSYPSLIMDINIGCGFRLPATFRNPERLHCPEHKFSYLSSSMIAEMTPFTNQEGDVKVHIWPSLIMATSLDITAMMSLAAGLPDFEDDFAGNNRGATGPQIMRMRYAKNIDTGRRDRPIEGWIRRSSAGPQLEATIELYLDVPYISDLGIGFINSGNNMSSYPILMKVRGPVSFLSDGRMVVEQFNTEEIEIHLKLADSIGSRMADMDLVIPMRGASLKYISEVVD
ncbi:Ig-like domain-containing protein [Alcanivorax quisquiliarum]|uniref:Ig-like domain-containing protein n=1 Tax=Alcanivorax quisquiliarum TaxID=2933565 RepID=A0ABT0E915_9GAMM|nr:Ig-like domain-containing protein [Alcanivorax quisquiliarum]MCK0538333.1 Ig-like domain-containing protein [Alcanivorax quisquiliarum]